MQDLHALRPSTTTFQNAKLLIISWPINLARYMVPYKIDKKAKV